MSPGLRDLEPRARPSCGSLGCAYTQAVESPSELKARREHAKAFVRQAKALSKAGRNTEAIEVLRRVVEETPTARFLTHFAQLHVRAAQHEEALAQLDRALATDPRYRPALERRV